MPPGHPLLRRLSTAACAALAVVFASPLAAKPAAAAPASATATSGANADTAGATPAAKPALAVVFVTPDTILAENFPHAATLADWLKPVLTTAESALADAPDVPALLIQITLSPDEPPHYELAGRPVLPDAFAAALHARLVPLPDLRAPLCKVCVRVQTPGGTASPLTEAATFIPRLFPPEETAINGFLATDLAAQYRELRTWARTHALPLLAHHAAASDPQYAGVVATGRAIAALGPDAPIDVARLAYHNPDYWRGVMEMAPGDQLMASLPVFLHAASGEIDQASTLLALVFSFSRDGTLAHQLLGEFAARLGPFRRQLTAEVQSGVAFHDEGRFAEAIARHQRTLAAYPNSAWARYELFFSTVTRDGFGTKKKIKHANKLWDETAPVIFRCNPLYTSQFGATHGKTVGAMLDRLVLHRIANKPPEDFGERIGSFADIALRLEDYGTAGLLYWSALGTTHQIKGVSFLNNLPVDLTKDDVLARFLYCLEKLGVPQWKSEFEGDFTASFRTLDAALAAHRGQ